MTRRLFVLLSILGCLLAYAVLRPATPSLNTAAPLGASSPAPDLSPPRESGETEYWAPSPAGRRQEVLADSEPEYDLAYAHTPTPGASATYTASTPPPDLLLWPSATPTEAAEVQALREIQKLGDDGGQSSLISGARSRTGSQLSAALGTPTTTPSPSATPLQRVTGQARGYHLIYMMQPEARQTVNLQIETLMRAEIDQIYLGVLTDGTFSKNYPYLNQALRALSTEGRAVTLAIYLTNGATQRDWKDTQINAGFNLIDPVVFRELIQHDFATRDLFTRLIKESKPSFELNRSLSPRAVNLAVVMLEDNLDFAAYSAMRRMAEFELSGVAEVMRNPCPGCYRGNDQSSQGGGIELHLPAQLPALGSLDGFTLDGTGYHFDDEAPDGSPSIDDVKNMIELGMQRRIRYFGLWREELQGRGGPIILHPEDRVYAVPTEAHMLADIELLRHGLSMLNNG